MAKRKEGNKPENLDELIIEQLDAAFSLAEDYFITKNENLPPFATDNLNSEFIEALEAMAKYCEKASGGYSNLITSLSIKAVYGDKVDVRYHQVQIQNQTFVRLRSWKKLLRRTKV